LQTTVRVNETVQRLVGLMRLLSGVPGYKSFLYVGGGLELVPGEDLYAYANRICPNSFNIQDAQNNTRVEVMRRLADAANAYRISFNAFEASTFQLSMLASPEFRSALYTPGAAIERTRTLNLQNSLVLLARETGGKTLLNSNGFFPEAEVVDEALFSYYSLGYTPPHQGDGKPHNITIRLKEKNGRQLRYRQSYSQQTVAEKLEDNLMSALALGWSQNPLDVRLGHGVITPIEGKKDNFLVPVSVTIPVTKLVCSPEQEAGSLCRVRLQMRVSDDKDRVSPMFEKVYGIRVHEGTSPDEKITIQLNNKMRPGVHRLAVGVRDETGLATSYVVQSISVAGAPQTTAS
jgi:hypothetical protein